MIKGCIKNHRKAQEELYRTYFDIVKSMCWRYTKDEDALTSLINDSFLKVFKGIQSYSGKGSFEGWIRRITYHVISDHFRKEKKYRSNMLFIEKDGSLESEALEDLYYSDLVSLVNRLPQSAKSVFTMYAIDGFTHREIGEKLGLSEGTSKWYLNQARKELRELFKKQSKKEGYA